MTKLRIALSVLALSLTLVACAADSGVTGPADDVAEPAPSPGADGIGTSPSGPILSCESDGSAVQCEAGPDAARAAHVFPCGLWWSPTSVAFADARHASAPLDPDMAQIALPGGLSCSALLAAAPAVVMSQGGAAVVYYVAALGKPIKPSTRWCAWPPSCTNPDAACCTAECVQIGDQTVCSND